MAISVGVKSPYWTHYSIAGAQSYKFEVYIDGATRYTIIKNGIEAGIDVSDLVRDYIEVIFGGNLPDGPTAITNLGTTFSVTITAYTGLDGTGATAGTKTYSTRNAFLGYRYYNDSGTNFEYAASEPLVSSTTLYYPVDTSGYFYANESGTIVRKSVGSTATSVSAGGETITIKRGPCNKYDHERLVFINRYGMLQEVFFFAKKEESTNAKRQEYKSNQYDYDGSYSNTRHQVQTFDINGGNTFTLNTGYISEDYNEIMRELLLSDYVWMGVGVPSRPVIITDSSVRYKTSVNDKLVSYTVQVKDAFDLISSMR